MPRARNAPLAKASTARSQNTRRALKEKTNTVRSSTKTNDQDDGSSDKFVKTARSTRPKREAAAQDESMLVMAGGLGPANKAQMEDAAPSPRQIIQAKKAKVSGFANKISAPKQSARTQPPQSPVREAAPFDLNAQPADFSPSPPPQPAQLSVQRTARQPYRPPGSAARPHEASAAIESSLLALRNFKRRPRQPRMLQMVQQRRSSVQPSAYGNSELAGPNAGLDVTDDDEIEDLGDDFMPEAAGTPLQMRRGGRLSSAKQQRVMDNSVVSRQSHVGPKNPRKRTSGQGSSLISEPGDSARKRSKISTPQSSSAVSHTSALSALRERSQSKNQAHSPVVLVQDSQPDKQAPPTSTSSLSSPPPALSNENTLLSTARSLRQLCKAATSREGASAVHDLEIRSTDTFADPLSSSPPPEGTHVSATQGTDIMADPMTQVSPPPAATRTRRKTNAKPLSTSTLQALLPKRRQPQPRRKGRRCTEFEIESDEVEDGDAGTRAGSKDSWESEEDELNSHPPLRRETIQRGAGKSNAAAKSRKSKAGSRRTVSNATSKTKVKSKKSAKQPRTYGKAGATSDKENAGSKSAGDAGNVSLPDGDENEDGETSLLPDTSFTMAEVSAQSNELAEARKKFAAIDDWDMDFESVSRHEEEGRSSSQLWR